MASSAAPATTAATQTQEKKLPPPSPVRSILAGSLAGGIEIGAYTSLDRLEGGQLKKDCLLTDGAC